MKEVFLAMLPFLLIAGISHAEVWYVGAARTYTTPGQVTTLVHDGDTIFIDGGVYNNVAAVWNNKNLNFIGLGTDSNPSTMRYTGDIPNHKGIFVFQTPGTCDNPYFENLTFDSAMVSDGDGGNGAGIRFQATNITVNACRFTNCQNGILEGNANVTNSKVIIMNSEFYNNGYQLPNSSLSGYEHHIYISASADTLIVTNCWFHHPRGQANSLKTRAQRSFILYNLIDEEATGYGSWKIDIAQGGLNIIIGNIIIQGPAGANHGVIGYDAATNALEDFYFVNNTVINQYVGNIRYFNTVPDSGITEFKIYNNIFASVTGASVTMFSNNIPVVLDTSNNVNNLNYLTFGFTNPSVDDYSLTAAATGAINKGTDAGTAINGYSLTPLYMYQSLNTMLLPRTIVGGVIDAGAYEYGDITGILKNELQTSITIYPNPAHNQLTIHFPFNNEEVTVSIMNVLGQEVSPLSPLQTRKESTSIDVSWLSPGFYFVQLTTEKERWVGRFVKD